MVIASTSSRTVLIVFLLVVGVCIAGLAYFQRVTVLGKRDCAYASWKTAQYGECSSVCHGVQYATRSVMQEAVNGGRECDPLDAIRSQSCNTDVNCFQSCIPGDPSSVPWTSCPSCLNANIYPVQWKIIPPLQNATNGGIDCRLDDVLQTRPCEGFIPACPPSVDCVFSPYYTTSCNVLCGSGTFNILQSVSQFPEGDGAPCNPAFLTLQQACYVDCECLPFSGPFSTCNAACGLGIEARYQAGQPATCSSIETRSCMITECENDTCFPPSVEYIQALCILSCSGLPMPAFEPGVCSTSEMMTTICAAGGAFNPCAEPQDCSLTDWSPYSQCSIPQCSTARQDGGTRTSVRTIVSNAVGGGTPCFDEIMLITEPCNAWASVSYQAYNTVTNQFLASISNPECTASADCQYSAYYSVSGCNAPCEDSGFITYFRSVTRIPDSPFSGVQCDYSPQNLTSYSVCINNNVCKPCVWYSPLDDPSFFFQCQHRDVGWKSEFVSLASNSNDTDCFTSGATCTFETTPTVIGNDTYTNGLDSDGNYRTLTCKAYGDVCSGFSQCPAPTNLVCNGQGIPVTVGNTCTCECFDGWSGDACDTFFGIQCPLGSNTQPCSGVGSCNLLNGSCTCPNGDTTPNCSAQALAWCWVFADYVMDPCEDVSDFSWRMSKLMGAFPILDSSYGSFSVQDCTNVNSQWAEEDAGSVVLTSPAPLLSSTPPVLQTCTIRSARFDTQVRSDPPSTLYHPWRLLCDMQSEDAILDKVADTTQFVHRLIPASFPTRCESLFSQSFITNPNDIEQNVVQLETEDERATQFIFSFTSLTTGIPSMPNTYNFIPGSPSSLARRGCRNSPYLILENASNGYVQLESLFPPFPVLPASQGSGLVVYSITSSATSASLTIPLVVEPQCPFNPSTDTTAPLPESGCYMCSGLYFQTPVTFLVCDSVTRADICLFQGNDFVPSVGFIYQSYSSSFTVIGGSYTGSISS